MVIIKPGGQHQTSSYENDQGPPVLKSHTLGKVQHEDAEIDGEAVEKQAMIRTMIKKKKEEDVKLWEKLYQQIRYSPASIDQCPSLKEVFKQRVQFSDKASKKMERLERKYIHHTDKKKF